MIPTIGRMARSASASNPAMTCIGLQTWTSLGITA